jgi:hypothetical protein
LRSRSSRVGMKSSSPSCSASQLTSLAGLLDHIFASGGAPNAKWVAKKGTAPDVFDEVARIIPPPPDEPTSK